MKFIAIMTPLLMFSSSVFGEPKKVQGKSSVEGEPEVIVIEGERWPGSAGAGGALSTPGNVIGSGRPASSSGGSKSSKIGNDSSNGVECKDERIRNGALCGYEIWGSEFAVGKHAIFFVCRKVGKVVRSNFVKCD